MKRFAVLAVLGAVALAVTLSVGAWGKGQGNGHAKAFGPSRAERLADEAAQPGQVIMTCLQVGPPGGDP